MTTISERYQSRVAEGDIDADPAQEDVLPEFDRLQRALEAAPGPAPSGVRGWFRKAPEPVKGLYVWGGVGVGKSMLMDLFHDAVDIDAKRRVHFHAFMQEVQDGVHAERQKKTEDAIRPVADGIAQDVRLLCFDEMQITDIADAMIVGRLFERLFELGVVVVTTSNRPPDDLYKDGLNREIFVPFIDLLKKRTDVHHLDADRDYRQDTLSGAQVFFTPADAEARRALDDIWQRLAGGPGEAIYLPVKTREVEIPEFRAGVARASFYDLCNKALGAADYLAVAEAVRVLILEGVPRMSSENYNQARRFVTLIDALYEARVRLIMSAADQPENLYIEGTGSFEFERTASRLREMQSGDWAEAED